MLRAMADTDPWTVRDRAPDCGGDLVRSRARAAYLRLREQILCGHLPPLQQLKIVSLCDQLSVNSSAVREALSRLTAEHLVEARDQQGFRVAPLSLEEFDDIARTWIDIESIMLRRAIESGDAAWEDRVRNARSALLALRETGTVADSTEVHAAYQDALMSGCSSITIHRIRDTLIGLSARYKAFVIETGEATWPLPDPHDEVAIAALARDADRATAALARDVSEMMTVIRDPFIRLTAPAGKSTSRCSMNG